MSAYMITQIAWKTPEARQQYVQGLVGTIEKHGGKWLVASSEPKVMEGSWKGGRTVVAQFPTMKDLTAWYESDEYRPLKELRLKHSDSDTIFIEGT